jgi:hypothetical protein
MLVITEKLNEHTYTLLVLSEQPLEKYSALVVHIWFSSNHDAIVLVPYQWQQYWRRKFHRLMEKALFELL